MFNVMEYFLSLNYIYLVKDDRSGNWAPWGEYVWKKDNYNKSYLDEMLNEAEIENEYWQPLKDGMFDSKYQNFKSSKDKLEAFLKGLHIR